MGGLAAGAIGGLGSDNPGGAETGAFGAMGAAGGGGKGAGMEAAEGGVGAVILGAVGRTAVGIKGAVGAGAGALGGATGIFKAAGADVRDGATGAGMGAGAGLTAKGTGGAMGFGTIAVGASPNPEPGAGSFGEAGAGGIEGWEDSEPRGRVTESVALAEFNGLPRTFEVGGRMAEGAIWGAAAVEGRGGKTLPETAPGFGGSEILMVSFLILPCVIFNEGLGNWAVGAAGIKLLGGVLKVGTGGAAGRGAPGAGTAAADREELMAIVCLGSDIPTGISGFWVMRFGGATGNLAPAGKFGFGGGGGGKAILGTICQRERGRQSF